MKKGVNGSWDKISTHLTGTEFNFQFRTRHFYLYVLDILVKYHLTESIFNSEQTLLLMFRIGAEGLLYEKDVHSPGYH